jgi:hypothetical protein
MIGYGLDPPLLVYLRMTSRRDTLRDSLVSLSFGA